MNIADLGTALLLGLAGSGHCLGMCGGIAVALRSTPDTIATSAAPSSSAPPSPPRSATRASVLMPVSYHLGRLISYGLLGALIGSAAGAVELAAWTVFLRFLAGFLLVAMGLHTLKLWFGITQLEKLGGHVWRKLAPVAQKFMPPKHPSHGMLLGAIWGFMPCGLIYSALTWSAAAGAGAIDSGLLMVAFGAGTLPAMLSATLLGQRASAFLSLGWVRKALGTLLVLTGIWTLWLTFSHLDHLLGQHGGMNHSMPSGPAAHEMHR